MSVTKGYKTSLVITINISELLTMINLLVWCMLRCQSLEFQSHPVTFLTQTEKHLMVEGSKHRGELPKQNV